MGGYSGEAHFMNPQAAFVCGLAGWGFILYEIFAGEAGQVCADGPNVNKHVKESFTIMRFIVTVGWSIYPLGYFFGYLCGAVDDDSLNLVYNLADFVNKIAFCLAIWASAKNSTLESPEASRPQEWTSNQSHLPPDRVLFPRHRYRRRPWVWTPVSPRRGSSALMTPSPFRSGSSPSRWLPRQCSSRCMK